MREGYRHSDQPRANLALTRQSRSDYGLESGLGLKVQVHDTILVGRNGGVPAYVRERCRLDYQPWFRVWELGFRIQGWWLRG